jgi:lipoprotein-anchoring transpeptidase ErfK/SrfK
MVTRPAEALWLGAAYFSFDTTNPWLPKEQVTITLSRPAHVQVHIVPGGRVHPVRTLDLGVRPAGIVHFTWDGRDHTRTLAPPGSYTYTFVATDATGARQREIASDDGIAAQRIVISLARQRLWAYDGFHLVLTTLVTTGNPALPTPQGHFAILLKQSPIVFISPWPPGSLYYYPPSPANYALLFDYGGYYIHDAPWRSRYGPGSNASAGTPGQATTGTHGCVNVPFAPMQQLYWWVNIGSPVEIVR